MASWGRTARTACMAVCALQLAGCAALITTTETTDPDLVVCMKYGSGKGVMGFGGVAEKYGAEIRRRGLLSEKEWQAAAQGAVFLGMSTCGLYASLGRPHHENKTVTASTDRIQHVYRGIYSVRGTYVYTDRGKVTAWQN